LEWLLSFSAEVAEAKGAEDGATKEAVLSPDGTRLYVLQRTMNTTRDAHGKVLTRQVAQSLLVIDTGNGRQIASRDSRGSRIDIMPDGAHVLLQDTDGSTWWTEVLDTGSLQVVARLSEWEVTPARRIDGQSILLASQSNQQQTQLAMLDPQTFSVLHTWSASGYEWWDAVLSRNALTQ
jgi:hypothetical protein